MSYTGFKKLREKLSKEKGVSNPSAIAASVMRKKYSQKEITKHQESGTSMKNVKPKKVFG